MKTTKRLTNKTSGQGRPLCEILARDCPQEDYDQMMKQIKDPTAPERVARDRAKKLKAGLVRVNVWVPAEHREDLLRYAHTLRESE